MRINRNNLNKIYDDVKNINNINISNLKEKPYKKVLTKLFNDINSEIFDRYDNKVTLNKEQMDAFLLRLPSIKEMVDELIKLDDKDLSHDLYCEDQHQIYHSIRREIIRKEYFEFEKIEKMGNNTISNWIKDKIDFKKKNKISNNFN